MQKRTTRERMDVSKATAIGFHPTKNLVAFCKASETLDEDFNITSTLTVWNNELDLYTSVKTIRKLNHLIWMEDYLVCFNDEGYVASFYYKEVKELPKQVEHTEKPVFSQVDIDSEFADTNFDFDDDFFEEEEEIKETIKKETSEIIKIADFMDAGVGEQIFAASSFMKMIIGASHCLNFYFVNKTFDLNKFLENREISSDNPFFLKTFKTKLDLNSPTSISWNHSAPHIIAVSSQDAISIQSLKKKNEIHRIERKELKNIQNVQWDSKNKASLFIQTLENVYLYNLNTNNLEKMCKGGNSIEVKNDEIFVASENEIRVYKYFENSTNNNNLEGSTNLDYNRKYLELIQEINIPEIKRATFKIPVISLTFKSDSVKITTLDSLFSTEKKCKEITFGKNIYSTSETYKLKKVEKSEQKNLNNILRMKIADKKYKNFDLQNNFFKNILFSEENEIGTENVKIPLKYLNDLLSKKELHANSDETLKSCESFETLVALSVYFDNYKELENRIENQENEILALLLLNSQINPEKENLLRKINKNIEFPINAYISLYLKEEDKFLSLMKGKVSIFEYNDLMSTACFGNLLNSTESDLFRSNILKSDSPTQKISADQNNPIQPNKMNISNLNPINHKMNIISTHEIKRKPDIKNLNSSSSMNSNVSKPSFNIPKPSISNINLNVSNLNVSKPSIQKPRISNLNISKPSISNLNIQRPKPPILNSNLANKNLIENKNLRAPIPDSLKKKIINKNLPPTTSNNINNNPINNNIDNNPNKIDFEGFLKIYDILLEINSKKSGVIYRSRVRNAEQAKNAMILNKDSISEELMKDLEPLFTTMEIERVKYISENPEDIVAKDEYKNSTFSTLQTYSKSLIKKYEYENGVKLWLEPLITLVRCIVF